MIKKVTILLISAIICQQLSGQDNNQSKNGLLISFGGEGGIYTLGYEHKFGSKKISRPFLHAGFSVFPIDQRITFAFPVSVGIMYSRTNFDFLIGAGLGPNISYYYQQFSSGTSPARLRFYSRVFFEAGGRYNFKQDKYSIGLRYTPFISFIENFQFEHWGAVTFGITLKSKKK